MLDVQVPAPPAGFGRHISETVRLAVPVMLSRAGLVLMLFVDTAIVGHLGETELARFGTGLIPVIVFQTAAVGLLISVIVRTAHLDGAGKRAQCGQVWRLGCLLALTVGVISAAVLSLGETLLMLIGQPPDLATSSAPVLGALGWGLPGLLLFLACALFLEGLNRPHAPVWIMAGGNLLNLVLGLIFGYGWLGAPEMGAEGVAIATSIARWIMGISAIVVILRQADRDALGIGWRLQNGLSGWRELLTLGVPLAVAIGLETTCFSLIVNMSGWLGKTSIATMHPAINFTSLVYMLTIGLGTAAAVRVANAVSRDDWENASRAGWVAVGMTATVMAVLGVVTALLSDQIAAIYTSDVIVRVALAALLGTLISGLILVDGLQGVLMGALRGCSDTLIPTVIYAVSFWVFGVPIGYWWGYRLEGGPPALTGALIIALAVAMIGLGWRFRRLTTRSIMENGKNAL